MKMRWSRRASSTRPLPERAWPYLQRIMGCDEQEARAHADTLAASMRATNLQVARLRRELELDEAAPKN